MANTDALPQLLTIDQLAERLGVSIRHIRRLIAEATGALPEGRVVHQIRPGRNRRLARRCSASPTPRPRATGLTSRRSRRPSTESILDVGVNTRIT